MKKIELFKELDQYSLKPRIKKIIILSCSNTYWFEKIIYYSKYINLLRWLPFCNLIRIKKTETLYELKNTRINKINAVINQDFEKAAKYRSFEVQIIHKLLKSKHNIPMKNIRNIIVNNTLFYIVLRI